MLRGYRLFILFCLAIAPCASAQPSLSSTSPTNNARNVAKGTNLSASFSESMAGASASDFAVRRTKSVHSGGAYAGQSTSTLSLNPTNDFLPGEIVRATLTSALQSSAAQGLSNPKSFSFRVASGSGPGYFADARTNLPIVNQSATAILAADLNGDGQLDVIVSNANSQNRVYFRTGNDYVASGSFGSGTDNTYALDVGDVDGDGDLDIVAANFGGADYVYYNNGVGSFSSFALIGGNGTNTVAIKLGDFDNDGDLDVVAVYHAQQSKVFANAGNGSFGANGSNVGVATRFYKGVAVGDLDNDGDLDLVMVASGNTAALGQNETYLNSGQGTSFNASAFGTGVDPSSCVALGDVDGDGDLDMLVGAASNNPALLYTNNGSGSMSLAYTFTGTSSTRAAILCDLDGDGSLDALLASESAADSAFIGNGAASFGTARAFGGSVKTVGMDVADMDGDGDLDVLAGIENTSIANRIHYNEIGAQTIVHTAMPAAAHEAIGMVTISVARNGSTSGQVSVDYATSNGTATAGDDYTAASGNLMWGNGDGVAKTFTIPITEDSMIENNETILVILSNISGAMLSSSTITVTILDNDTEPTVNFAQTNTNISEAVTPANIQITLSAPYQQNVTIDYATGGGSATAGQDYQAVAGTMTFVPGETSKSFAIPVIDDAIQESSESVTLSISNPGNSSLGSVTFSTLTILDDDANGLVLSIDPSSINVAEDGMTATVTVKLSSLPVAEVTVDFATSDDTASAGTDYTATNGTLTFGIGETTKTFDVTILDDMLDENDETITITLSNASNAALPNPATATITISDNDATPSLGLNLATLTVGENVGNAQLTVTLSTASGRAVSVNFATSDSSANAGSDYTTTSGVLSFGIGETSKTIMIPIIDDSADEDAEDFTLTLSAPNGASLATAATTITITDNDAAPSVALMNATMDVNENTSPASITVVLSAASGKTVTVDYATTNGTALAASDYTAASGTLTLMPGQSSKTISVVILDDNIDENNETCTLTISAPTNATLGTTTTTTLTILDDEATPTLAFTQANWNVNESAGTLTLDVMLSGQSAHTVNVSYATAAGSALATSDFTTASGMLSFAPLETQKMITLTIINNAIFEADESFTLTLVNPSNAGLGAIATATITINDDEAQPTLSFVNATPSANEAAATINIALVLSGAAQAAITVEFSAAAGTATPLADFDMVTSQVVNFAPGVTMVNAMLTLKQDALDEDDETILLSIANPTIAALGTAAAVFTILDDDATPTLALSSATYSGAENGGSIVATVNLSAASGRTLSIDFATSNGSATAPADYDAQSGTLTFTAGQTSKMITIVLNDDLLIEGLETITLTLSNPVKVGLAAPMAATLTILDDESPPELIFAQAGYDVAENGGMLSVEVKLTKASNQAVSVDYATLVGTASAPNDFTAQSNTLNFAIGETSKLIMLIINDDLIVEDNETFSVELTNPLNATIGTASMTTVTILEDDQPVLSFTAANAAPSEGAGMIQIDLLLSVASFMPITVDVLSSDQTATAGADYVALNQPLTFLAGQTTKSVMLMISEDGADEPDETLMISLANLVNATLGVQNSVLVTIADNDVPMLSLTKSVETVAETALSLSMAFTLDIPSWQDVDFDFASADFSAFAGSDYVATSGHLTLSAGMTSGAIMISILDDVFIESDETFTLTLSNPLNALLGNASATITITSNDLIPTVSLRPAMLSLAEASGQNFLMVELSEAFTSSLSVRVASAHVATSAADFTAISQTLLFTPGQMIKMVAITINDDGIFESDESFVVSLSMPSGVLIDGQANTSTITILDDDLPKPPAPPSFVDLQVLDPDNAYRGGETITIEANLGVAGLIVEADLSVLDGNFSGTSVIPYFGSGRYRLTTSALNPATLIEGVDIPVQVTARDGAGQSVQGWLAITIDNTGANSQLFFNAPANSVPAGDFEITLAFDEPVISVPLISISGLGVLSVNSLPMVAAVPSLSFRYVLNVPMGSMGNGLITVTPPQDLAGNLATVTSGAMITLTGGAAVLRADAGGDQVINAPQTVMLDGSGSFGASGYLWTRIAGPINVTPTPNTSSQPSVALNIAGDYLFRLDVSSAAGMASDAVLISFLDGAPSVDAGADIVVAPQEVVVQGSDLFVSSGLSATVIDPTQDEIFVTWYQVAAPLNGNVTIASRNSVTSALQVYGSVIEAGVYEFEIRVQDRALIARKQFVTDRVRLIVIGDGTRPPTADAGADQMVAKNALVILNGGRSSDPDAAGGPALTYTWSLLEKPSASTTSLQGTSNQNTAFVADQAGRYRLGLVVRDVDGLTSLEDVVEVFAFDASNNMPRAGVTQSPSGTIFVGQPVTFDATLATAARNYLGGQDFEGDILSAQWSFIDGPSTINIADPTNSVQGFTFTMAGIYRFRVTSNDGLNEGLPLELSVRVQPIGRAAPVAMARIASEDDSDGDRQVLFVPSLGVDRDTNNRQINLVATGSSVAAGQAALYRWRQLAGPAVGLIGSSTASAAFVPIQAGVYRFELQVSDDSTSALRELSLAVDTHDALENPTGNALPRVTVPADLMVKPNELVTLTGTGFDPNGSAVTLTWVQISGPPVFFARPSAGVMTFTPLREGDFVFALFADDGQHRGLTREVTVTVRGAVVVVPGPSGGGGGGGGGGCALQDRGLASEFLVGILALLMLFGRQSFRRRATHS